MNNSDLRNSRQNQNFQNTTFLQQQYPQYNYKSPTRFAVKPTQTFLGREQNTYKNLGQTQPQAAVLQRTPLEFIINQSNNQRNLIHQSPNQRQNSIKQQKQFLLVKEKSCNKVPFNMVSGGEKPQYSGNNQLIRKSNLPNDQYQNNNLNKVFSQEKHQQQKLLTFLQHQPLNNNEIKQNHDQMKNHQLCQQSTELQTSLDKNQKTQNFNSTYQEGNRQQQYIRDIINNQQGSKQSYSNKQDQNTKQDQMNTRNSSTNQKIIKAKFQIQQIQNNDAKDLQGVNQEIPKTKNLGKTQITYIQRNHYETKQEWQQTNNNDLKNDYNQRTQTNKIEKSQNLKEASKQNQIQQEQQQTNNQDIKNDYNQIIQTNNIEKSQNLKEASKQNQIKQEQQQTNNQDIKNDYNQITQTNKIEKSQNLKEESKQNYFKQEQQQTNNQDIKNDYNQITQTNNIEKSQNLKEASKQNQIQQEQEQTNNQDIKNDYNQITQTNKIEKIEDLKVDSKQNQIQQEQQQTNNQDIKNDYNQITQTNKIEKSQNLKEESKQNYFKQEQQQTNNQDIKNDYNQIIQTNKIESINNHIEKLNKQPNQVTSKNTKPPIALLLGTPGVGKTFLMKTIFNRKIINEYQLYKLQLDDTLSYNFVDTQGFNFEEDIDVREAQISKYQKLFNDNKDQVYSIFIVVNFERTDLMKKNILSIYKFFRKFSSLISIIVTEFQLSDDKDQDEADLTAKLKIFKPRDIIFVERGIRKEDLIKKMKEKSLNQIESDFKFDITDTIFEKADQEEVKQIFDQLKQRLN
ncbi:unnamed protein product [Paramecium primaurelia]|uniref:P-loop containing nucleoside triphosphate hydrolase n=1 Tax=Paramecium primaurelia TaxID=5886 RepID=A0A8S1QET4_PARPR|nr:unnamed protein product [Paramecium primaurelia]